MNDAANFVPLVWTIISVVAFLVSFGEWKEAKEDNNLAKTLPAKKAGGIIARNNYSRAWKLTIIQLLFVLIGLAALFLGKDNELRMIVSQLTLIFCQLGLMTLVFEQRWTRSKLNVANLAEVDRLEVVEADRVEDERVEGNRREAKGYAEADKDTAAEGDRREAKGYAEAGEDSTEKNRVEGNRREAKGYAAAAKSAAEEAKRLLVEMQREREVDRPAERSDRKDGLGHRKKNMKEEYDRGYDRGQEDEKEPPQ